MITLRRFALSVFCIGAVGFASAVEDAATPPSVEDAELKGEIAYIEALIDAAYPDIAEPLIVETKKRWPQSEPLLFAIEVRGMLSLGKFDEANRMIAALPDRNGLKYWSARIEVANNYYSRGQKAEGSKIYEEFFKIYPKPPKDIRDFYLTAKYMYGQQLFLDRDYSKAAAIYEGLLAEVKGDQWCDRAAEAVKMYLKLADEKKGAEREDALKKAEKIVDKLLWHLQEPVYFGLAVSMKAHIEVMRGHVSRATEIIDEYKPQLQEVHNRLVEADPDGRDGLLRLSPLPECLYLEAKIMWDEVRAEMKKPKRDDDKIKALLFGSKLKNSSKRNGKGAFNYAINVFVNYEMSPWASSAGDLSDEIRDFTKKTYGKTIKTSVTPEQRARVRAAQFKTAQELFLADRYGEAVEAYGEVLAKYPEYQESANAIANVISAMLDMIAEEKSEAAREELRIELDAIEGYLSERFACASDRNLMIAAGNALSGAAAKERERGQIVRSDSLYTAFFMNYREHPNAASLAVNRASLAQKDGKFAEAISIWSIVENCYSNTPNYTIALSQLATCWGKQGDSVKEIEYINRYLPLEKNELRRLQAKMRLAQMYQKNGIGILANAETNSTPEAVAVEAERGVAEIMRAIEQFTGFAADSQRAMDNPATTKVDRERYAQLRDAAMFMVGECWSRVNTPKEKLAENRAKAALSYEEYVKSFPNGQYVKLAYNRLGMIYTVLGNMEKAKNALDTLTRLFPDSEEAKNAKPRLARSLMEIGLRREGAEIYSEMLRTDGKYTAGQFLAAGEALIEARSWDLANQAFEKAIRLAGTNQWQTIAKAHMGKADTAFKQGSLAEAREALDEILQHEKMSKMLVAADANLLLVEVASKQGSTEKDKTLRSKYFGAAVTALRKVRGYWAKREQWEQNRLDIMSGEVQVRKMKSEDAMGLKEDAMETCGLAAATFLAYIQAHGVSPEYPFDKMSAGDQENLEKAYANAVPLFVRLGADNADRAIKYGTEYLEYFPNGKFRSEVQNSINQAKALGSAPAEKSKGE